MNAFIKAYSYLNLGDDLFVKILCDRYPDTKFKIVTHYLYKSAFEKIENLEVIVQPRYIDTILSMINKRFSFNNYFARKFIKNSDITIHIGGSIFIQTTDWEKRHKEYEKDINNSEKFVVLGANFGPYNNPEYKKLYEKSFSEINDIVFRDQKSNDLFPKLENKRLAPDIVFSMKSTVEIEESQSVVIVLINLENREELSEYKNDYESKLIEACEAFNHNNTRVTLMGFCDGEDDQSAIDRIQNRLSFTANEYLYQGNIDEALHILQEAKGIIATRFHAMVLGWIYGKPVYPIAYSGKMTNVMNDLDFDNNYCTIPDIKNIDIDEIVDFINNYEEFDISKTRQEAEKHFLFLDQILKKKD